MAKLNVSGEGFSFVALFEVCLAMATRTHCSDRMNTCRNTYQQQRKFTFLSLYGQPGSYDFVELDDKGGNTVLNPPAPFEAPFPFFQQGKSYLFIKQLALSIAHVQQPSCQHGTPQL